MLDIARDGATLVLTMNEPARRNALSMDMRQRFIAALESAEGDATIRAVVITGAGGQFCGGGDITGMDSADFGAGRERFRLTHKLVRLQLESAKPFVAAVEGWAAGAAVGLAIGCDSVVAAHGARFVTPFVRIGLIPDYGLLHTLPRRIGEGRARNMFLSAEPVDSAEALRIGLVDQVVADGAALEHALIRARKLAEGAPQAIAMTRSILARGLVEALEWERTGQAALFLTADHAEGKAAFLGKRKPVFKGV
jgi:2-(1,2-epoxy-1,2-dihydrophenyl)acetyl-CoA isomerase